MTRQLKIIIEYEEEGIDSDVTGPLMVSKVNVYRDDERIGVLQAINFTASVYEPCAQLELVFPDYDTWAHGFSTNLIDQMEKQIKFLSEIIGVKVIKRL